MAVQPPARPRDGVRRDAGIAPAAPPRPAGRSNGSGSRRRCRSRRWPSTVPRRAMRRLPSRCSSRPPPRPSRWGPPNEAAGFWRNAADLATEPDDIAQYRAAAGSALEAARRLGGRPDRAHDPDLAARRSRLMPWTAGRIHGPAAAHSAFQLRATVGRVVDEERGTHVGAPAQGRSPRRPSGGRARRRRRRRRAGPPRPAGDRRRARIRSSRHSARYRRGRPGARHRALRATSPTPARSGVHAAKRTVSGPTVRAASGSYSSMAKAVVEEAGSFRDRRGEVVEPAPTAGREMDGERRRTTASPREEVAQARQVEEMVGVHVTDDDARQLLRIGDASEAVGHALTDIEEEGRLLPLDEEPRGRGVRVGERVAAAEHGQPQAAEARHSPAHLTARPRMRSHCPATPCCRAG